MRIIKLENKIDYGSFVTYKFTYNGQEFPNEWALKTIMKNFKGLKLLLLLIGKYNENN